jgi:hypothetical protein
MKTPHLAVFDGSIHLGDGKVAGTFLDIISRRS